MKKFKKSTEPEFPEPQTPFERFLVLAHRVTTPDPDVPCTDLPAGECIVYRWTGRNPKFEFDPDPRLYVEWVTGGFCGGSCYGDSPESVSGDAPEDLEVFDVLLERMCPQISFLQYKSLHREVVQAGTRTGDSDYYGNYRDYAYKRVPLGDLYAALRKRGLLPADVPLPPEVL
jgi:hypothetical protein